jgi:hypothetical protein
MNSKLGRRENKSQWEVEKERGVGLHQRLSQGCCNVVVFAVIDDEGDGLIRAFLYVAPLSSPNRFETNLL